MSKYTPGEWKITEYGAIATFANKNVEQTVICTINKSMFKSEYEDVKMEAEANVKLICAAPDLLDALEYAKQRIVFLEGFTEGKADLSDMKIINSAIKKATI